MDSKFEGTLQNNMLITGGHIKAGHNEDINEGTLKSFKMAVALYGENKNKFGNLCLGILINDIGVACNESGCNFSSVSIEDFQLPKIYSEVLNENGVSEDDLILISERHCRNRGKKLLNKEIKKGNPQMVLEDEGYFYVDNDKSMNFQLTRINTADKVGTPACPLIMCAFCLEHLRNGCVASLNFYYVGEDNMSNIPNYYVIENGYKIALCMDESVDTKNVYIFEDAIMKNFD